MKKLISAIVLLSVAMTLSARDIRTMSGTVYKDATVFSSTPGELVISFKSGKWTVLKAIPFTDLPEDIRKEYKYDPAQGKAYMQGVIDWQKKMKQEKAEAAQKRIDDENKLMEYWEENMKVQEQEHAEIQQAQKTPDARDSLAQYLYQLTSASATEVNRGQAWKDMKFKSVVSSGTVKDVEIFDDTSMSLCPGEDGPDVLISHTSTNAWQVPVFNPNYPSSIKVYLIVFNCDTAKNLVKGQKIQFQGVIWRYNNNCIYLNPIEML